MNRRNVSLIIAGAIIIMILLIGAAVLRVILNGAAVGVTPLPSMPTFDSLFSTAIPTSTYTSVPSSTNTSTNTTTPATPTQTSFPLFVLNGTPVYPTARPNNNNPARTPTPTPLSANLWTYTPTPFPTFTPTPTPTPTRTASQVQPCRNILIPVAVGQQWRYQANALSRSDTINMSVLSVSGSQGNIQVNNLTTGASKQVQVQCDGDVIRGFPSIGLDAIFGSTLNSNMTASYISGALAPNEAAFLNNNWALAWSTQYLVSGTTVLDRNGTQLSVTLNNAPVTLNCQTVAVGDAAFETISVGAGTFRALKVVCTESGQVTAVINGITVSGLAEGRSNQWFAPKIGLVKMQVVSITMRVLEFPFSLLVDNSLDLQSYISAP